MSAWMIRAGVSLGTGTNSSSLPYWSTPITSARLTVAFLIAVADGIVKDLQDVGRWHAMAVGAVRYLDGVIIVLTPAAAPPPWSAISPARAKGNHCIRR
jgi:hypothetical protein